jgi:Sigma-70, region 4
MPRPGTAGAGQRAAIVLRYWEDLSESEAADVLGCSASTVSSATARGLRRLRELSGASPAVAAEPRNSTVISTEFEDRLREEMQYATADVPASAGLVRRAAGAGGGGSRSARPPR